MAWQNSIQKQIPETKLSSNAPTDRKRGTVKNYSAGGVAFFMEKDWKLSVGDSLTEIHLNIREGGKSIRFQIPKAAIRRIEPRSLYAEKALCAIEFVEIQKEVRNNILSHVFRQQRVMIQRIRTGLHK